MRKNQILKTIVFVLLLLIVAPPELFAQQALKQALDDFHYTLAFTYHPMADDSNFTPIRKRSTQLAAGAAEVKRVSDSLGSKNASLLKGIKQLAEQCRGLDESIQRGSTDEVIRKQLTAIHSKFHEIDEMVSEGKEK
jgi:hypothetical protein